MREDADRDLGVVADDLDELMKAVDPSTAQLLAPSARGLQDHLHDLEQFDEAICVTLTSLAERLGSLTSGRTMINQDQSLRLMQGPLDPAGARSRSPPASVSVAPIPVATDHWWRDDNR